MQLSIPLYFYGELSPEEEERVDEHLDGCEPCRGELDRLRMVAAALDRREMTAPSGMIDDCRERLMDAIHDGVSPASVTLPAPLGQSFGERVSALMAALRGLRQPIGAVALLAVGY